MFAWRDIKTALIFGMALAIVCMINTMTQAGII